MPSALKPNASMLVGVLIGVFVVPIVRKQFGK